jgi:hypothetical protein
VEKGNGAQGRDRTTDTVIFSHVLYQLSYLGAQPRRAVERGVIVACLSPVQNGSGTSGGPDRRTARPGSEA